MDKNTILAFILIAIIIIIYPYFMPKQEVIQKSETTTVIEEKKAEPVQAESNMLSDNKTEYAKEQTLMAADESNNYYAPEEKDIKIETDLFRAVISTRDGIIKSWKVKQYKSRADTSKIVELIKEGTKNLETEIRLSNGSVIKNVVFEADTDDIKISGEGETADLVLSYKDADGQVKFTKSYRFYSDKYSFDLSIDTTPVFSDLAAESAVGINWRDGVKFSEVSDNGKNLNREDYYRATYVKTKDNFNEYDDNDDPEKTTGEINWGATRSKYFEVFLASTTEKLSSFENSPAHDKVEEHYTSMGFSVNFNKNTDPVKNLLVYFGPMDYETLKTYEKEFGLTLNWGWDIIKPFSLAIYWTLKYLHKFIDNYGLVIIILSLLVNTLVVPFTLKSYRSQAEMKKIQPEIKLIKEKYKADMQKQQQATMELYKKHGVNPFGTCLPTLLPMPILYGMFIVFGATIEFRSADFIWWINDLSLPEIMFTLPFSIPFYGANVGIMPILMGVTMFYQMKDTASADPNQKMMMYFMPVFLMVLFNNLSSGLILYYTIGNVYRMVQQKIMGTGKK